MVNTLYVVGMPVADPGDITFRALRILGEVALIVAADVPRARRLLAHYDIATPLAARVGEGAILTALEAGDVALLFEGQSPGPPDPDLELIREAIECGFPVVPVPGPSFPVAALVISGLPADKFVYLGKLPPQRAGRRALLCSVAPQQCTLVALESPRHLADALADLHDTLGDRPLAVVGEPPEVWRGTVSEALEQLAISPPQGESVLVIGGAQKRVTRWDEDQLRTEIQASLDQGLGVRAISRRLAAESGWPRREIYRLAVELGRLASHE